VPQNVNGPKQSVPGPKSSTHSVEVARAWNPLDADAMPLA
jgi:hypothetical protein